MSIEKVHNSTKEFVVGADDAGTGALAGELIIVAVKAPKDWTLEGLNDSKKLSEKKLKVMFNKIIEEEYKKVIDFVSWSTSPSRIDNVGIAECMQESYAEVFSSLYCTKSLIVMDGLLEFKKGGHNYDIVNVIKADSQVPTVMAASILAKNFCDDILIRANVNYPQYGWDKNKGYGTKDHLEAIGKNGPCMHHRFSYGSLKKVTKFTYKYGTKYLLEGKIHREGGPAIEYSNGDKEWRVQGKRHRLDGPAIEHKNGNKHWYYAGEFIECSSQKEFESLIKLRPFW
ncbi:hypothetical protein [Flavobacterium sp.]|uniref:hypothetical protein n=1 Tax=Flavobacterium sp. TaxID=239 RepID=UPI0032659951